MLSRQVLRLAAIETSALAQRGSETEQLSVAGLKLKSSGGKDHPKEQIRSQR